MFRRALLVNHHCMTTYNKDVLTYNKDFFLIIIFYVIIQILRYP